MEKQKTKQPSVFFTGLALFSMFFGAGNLIFPLVLGSKAGLSVPMGVIGFCLSAVALPLFGLMVMIRFGGNLKQFLSTGPIRILAPLILFSLQMSQGTFGAMPRLLTLMHASIKPFFSSFPLILFSFSMAVLIYYLTKKERKIIQILGSWMTPILLLSIFALVASGLFFKEGKVFSFSIDFPSLYEGISLGYQTTDFIAALLFSTMIIPHLSIGTNDPKIVGQRALKSSLIASFLLIATYVGLSFLAFYHSEGLTFLAPEDYVTHIATELFGGFGMLISCAAVFLACLTTVISLTSIFAGYVKEELFKGSFQKSSCLKVVLILSALFANFGFNGIVGIWRPILTVLYPLLVLVSVVNLVIVRRLQSLQPM